MPFLPTPSLYGPLALGLLLAGCTGPSKDDTGAADDSGIDAVDPICTEPEPPSCVDEMILDLSLHDDKVSDGEVTTVVDGADFVTNIDASAGGYSQAANNPWVYVRFGADGAERVDIDDESALEDMTWHLALRRYIVRVNSGDSGPSCVGAAAMLGYTYGELTEVPAGMNYLQDDYYTDDCTFVNDSSGLEGSPQAAMSAWWEYPGCVATTEAPFLVQLEDGRVIKLVVEKYYGGEGQDECNTGGSTTEPGGFYQIRWTAM
ncbi:MAG: HmuY family protein [Pseudomonadota bacterium]|nr:HmuY family protein [Pseudomonadota bacterium]